MASDKLPIHIDSLPQAVSVINNSGISVHINKIKRINKSAHFGEIVKLANKIIEQQNQQSAPTP